MINLIAFQLKNAARLLLIRARDAVAVSPILYPVARGVIRGARRIRVCARILDQIIEPSLAQGVPYDQWIANNDPVEDSDIKGILSHIEGFIYAPKISIVMSTYNTRASTLRDAISSVKGQYYPHWQLCIADDASTTPDTCTVLEEAAASDNRIQITRRKQHGHICRAGNSALELADGEFIALMDHDDLLAPQALYEVVAELNLHPDADLLYSDEDKIDDDGNRYSPYFKPDWDHELLLGQNYISHLGVYRRSIVMCIGGFRPGFEGSQDYDLALRFIERTTTDRIRHIPTVLYHWRQGGATRSFSEDQLVQCGLAAQTAVAEHLNRIGIGGATVAPCPGLPGWVEVKHPLPIELPKVSIIIPTRDHADLLRVCVHGILKMTDYQNIELIIVDNGSVEPETAALFNEICADKRVRVLRIEAPFNYSMLNNAGVAISTGDILLLLNNDTEVIAGDWLKALVAQVVRPEVGAVGARLLYPDGGVQHAGVIVGAGFDPSGNGGVANHILLGAKRADPGYFGILRLPHNVSAVTGACLAVRREVFNEVGGLDEIDLPVAFNDIDLCLKIRQRGYRVIWTPQAELFHHESATRGADTYGRKQARLSREIVTMQARWGHTLTDDPFYNPNFHLVRASFQLGKKSRRAVPWITQQQSPGHGAFVLRTSSTQDLRFTVSVCEQLTGKVALSPVLLDISGDRAILPTLAELGDPIRFIAEELSDIGHIVNRALSYHSFTKVSIYTYEEDLDDVICFLTTRQDRTVDFSPIKISV